MEKQMEHTPTPWHAERAQQGLRETIQAPNGQLIGVIADRSLKQGTPKGNRAFILRACNNHYLLLGKIEVLVEAIDDEGEHDHDPDECDVCYAVNEAKWLRELLNKQGETGANDLLLEAVELIEAVKQEDETWAANEDISPALRKAYESDCDIYQEWLDKAKGKGDGNPTR